MAEASNNEGTGVGKRCSMCGVTWPWSWDHCPQCGGEVGGIQAAPERDEAEAKSAESHRKFQEYLEREGRE